MSETQPLLDSLEDRELPQRKTVYIRPHVGVTAATEGLDLSSPDYLIATRITMMLGAEAIYSRDSYEAKLHSRAALRRVLARELYGNIETELLNLTIALHEEDLRRCQDIVHHMFDLIK